MADIGYVRVSSVDQNDGRQLAGVELDKKFKDKCSGKDTKRPKLSLCMDFLREGDTLHVHSIDRLARNMADLQRIVADLTAKKITVKFHNENLEFGTKKNPILTLQLQMMGAFAEFERAMIRERQREGILLAKQQGKQIGAKPKLKPKQIREIKSRLKKGETKKAVAKEYQVSRQTIYNILAG